MTKTEKRLQFLGLLGIISLLSYTAMVVFSPLAYPGYDWLSMAVSELSADGAPSQALATQLNCLFGPCGLVAVTAVCVACICCRSKVLRIGIYFYTAMVWVTDIGYKMFPWVSDAPNSHPQNIMHLVVTGIVVACSIVSLILIAIGGRKDNLKSLSVWAIVCFAAMMVGAIGTSAMPKEVFGLFERFSVFSAAVFKAVIGWYLFKGRFIKQQE